MLRGWRDHDNFGLKPMPIGSPEKEINPCTMDPLISQNNPMLNGSSKKLEKVLEPMAIGSPKNVKRGKPIPNGSPDFGNNVHTPWTP